MEVPSTRHTPVTEFVIAFRGVIIEPGAVWIFIAERRQSWWNRRSTICHFPLFPMADSKNASTSKPVQTYRLHGISVSIFANPTKVDGDDTVFHKVSIQRTYRDGDEFKTTTSFSRDDLPVVELLARRAWEWIHKTESSVDS